MIAELAAANAAFKVIQAALNNGKEIYDCAAAASSYFDNKAALSKKAGPGGKEDLQAFMALEKLKEQEEWLKESMIYAGRPNMYSDWLKYQSDCKRKRDAKERLRIKKRSDLWALIKEAFLWGIFGIVVVPLTIFIILRTFKVI
tara:strand:+ start:133 stop:564 length:432 start_codon:yes stop_codon:yes gene_type:complete